MNKMLLFEHIELNKHFEVVMKKLIKTFIVNNEKYVFNGNTMELFSVNNDEELCNYIEENEEELDNKDEENSLRKVVINVSNKCNLNCLYCYAEGGSYGRKDELMKKDTFIKIVDELINKGINRIGIVSFFGGEPLLNYKLIEYAIPYLKEKIAIDNIEIVTNAFLLNREIIMNLKKYDVSLSISFDGPENITDCLRGSGVYKRAVSSIELCKSLNYNKLCISATYTHKHEKMGYSYNDICKYLEQFDTKISVSRVLSSNKELVVQNKLTIEEASKDINRSFENILNNKQYTAINSSVYSLLLSLFCSSKSYTYCDDLLSSNSISYDYNGDKYNCFRFWGDQKYKITNEIISNLIEKENNKDNNIICTNCWAKKICKICTAAIKQGVDRLPISNDRCGQKEMYELVMCRLIELIQSEKHTILAKNFLDNFLIYK